VYRGLDAHGKQQFHWIGRFATKRERDLAIAKAKVESPWEDAPNGTVEEHAARMIARMESGAMLTQQKRRYKDSSIDTIRRRLKPLRRDFGPRDPASITRIEAEDWAATETPSHMPVVVQFFNVLYRAEIVDRNRFEGLGRRPEQTKDRTPPTEAEMVLLIEACAVLGDYAPIMRALLTFASYTLLRRCELRALDWHGIDLDAGKAGRATIPETKSNRPKTVTLIPTARAALEQLLEMPGYYPTGVVFPNKTGGSLTAPTMSAYWKEVRARAGVDVEFYVATKHYGVWYLKVREGLDNGAIGAQAGWSEKTVDDMVKTYSHSADARRLDDIDAHFAGKRDADRDATAAQTRS
jgi:integrase